MFGDVMMMMIVMMASQSGKRVYCHKILMDWVRKGGGKGEVGR